MTGACLTVSQVQSIPWSAGSSTRLLLVKSAFVTPIVTRGNDAKPSAMMAAAGGLNTVIGVLKNLTRTHRVQVRFAPLRQANALAGQFRSQPQQMRSGWLGFVGNFLAMVSFPKVRTDLRLCCVHASGLIEINLGEEYSHYKQLTQHYRISGGGDALPTGRSHSADDGHLRSAGFAGLVPGSSGWIRAQPRPT